MKKILIIFSLFFVNISCVLAESSAYLNSLGVDGYFLSPTFEKYNNTYTVNINEDETKLNILYETEDSNASVIITGNELKQQDNVIKIEVNSNQEKQIYTIFVNKDIEEKVMSINDESLELNISKKRNMKVVAAIIIICWLLCLFILKFILFKRHKN